VGDPLIRSLPDHDILPVADALRESAAEAGSAIVAEGDAGELFYAVTELDCAGGEREVARLARRVFRGGCASPQLPTDGQPALSQTARGKKH
jgi:hypothetical protein